MIAAHPGTALLAAALASLLAALLLGAMLWRRGARARRIAWGAGIAVAVLGLFQATLLALVRLWPGLAAIAVPAADTPRLLWPVVLNDIAMLLAMAALLLALRRLQRLQRESRLAATTDALTGLPNRQGFAALFEAAREELLLHGRPLSLLILDIDHFKGITDRHGRSMGEQVLQDFTGRVRGAVGGARVARLGGEEFAVLTTLSSEEALRLGQEIRHQVGRHRNGALPLYNCSVGVATATAQVNSLEALLGAADKALYYAKQDDRNRVAGAAPE